MMPDTTASSVRTKHGAQEEAVVSGIIKDGLRRLGAS